ncbi:DUF808 domain-containing protein [uncultured Paracoccus sp.]|uniref:DUF808 domain-containing protein n=1 Tax=uncultured Paracoccus sp. TaxID=189685 RepID=UPI00263442AC|nr:DUF808 domain-containing protein [uncultured Paracoccus sp.]
MSIGLLALLDDVAALAKVAAASLDDVAGQATKAGAKAAGVVIDDTAVTPRYVTGFAAAREVPIIWRIAKGSLRNKLLILLPAALALSALLPQAVVPLLMLGGIYLCYEGTEKLYETLFPHAAHGKDEDQAAADAALAELAALDDEAREAEARWFEDEKVGGAIKTDFILSAEIMAITLAAIPEGNLLTQALVMALVGIGITAGVYGVVALIVKADDAGVALARSRLRPPVGIAVRGLGRGLVVGMPYFLALLAAVGTAAMIWVGGGIILHGLEEFGLTAPAEVIHGLQHGATTSVAAGFAGVAGWLTGAAGAGVFGLAVGAVTIPLANWLGPFFERLHARLSGLRNGGTEQPRS